MVWSNKYHKDQTIERIHRLPYSVCMDTPRKLSNQDTESVLAYIAPEKEVNLFIEGDIELYGLNSDAVELFAFGDDWDSLLLRYYENFMITSNKKEPDLERVAAFLNTQKMLCLSAKEEYLLQISRYFPHVKIQGTYLCRLNKESFNPKPSNKQALQRLGPEHALSIVELYKQIEEFAQPYLEHEQEKTEQTRDNYEKGCIGYGIFEGGKLVCTATITAKTKSGAMIIGVATLPAYRKRGYASRVMSELCRQCFAEGLSFLCLFYDNPLAGAMYHSMGFETIGRWAMMRF
jgi:predicted GNAT family acetyltransferase